jgi:hypothetical protein
MEGYCSTGQSPQWTVVPVKEEEYKPTESKYYVIKKVHKICDFN